jgi:predicted N-formylglutamate amidohydrolase
MAGRRRAVTPVFSCEHARAAVPRRLGSLGLPAAVLHGHRGFDAGALAVARGLARAFGRSLHEGRWSRLVVDLNRAADHPDLIVRRVDGRAVPANAALDDADRQARLERYWRPYRAAVERGVAAAVGAGLCIHLSVHSFVERLHGVERTNDIGLLYDPARPRERAFVAALRRGLLVQGVSVRRNFPYFGDTFGLTKELRERLPAARYLGIEIELNQRQARTAAGQRRFAAALRAALRGLLTA